MKMITALVITSTLAATTMGCSAPPRTSDELGGTIAGGVVGGLIGSRFGQGGGKVLTTLIGAGIGAEIGKRLTRSDQDQIANTTLAALEGPPGRVIEWRNPDEGTAGVIRTRRDPAAPRRCRIVYQMVEFEDGEVIRDRDRYCRNRFGEWRRVS